MDPHLPRRRYWSTEVATSINVCPECAAALLADEQTYLMLVNCDGRPGYVQTKNSHGYFCPRCPLVVLDQPAFAQIAIWQGGDAGKLQFVVFGLVPDPADGGRSSEDLPMVIRFTNVESPMPKIPRA